MKTKTLKKITAILLIGVAILWLAAACQKSTGQLLPDPSPEIAGHSIPISADSANLMIQSYLNGIDYLHNTNEIKSLVCNADSLRAYLNNTAIKNVKLLFAHNMTWIDGGHFGERPGPGQNALTIIIAGLDSLEHYVSYPSSSAESFKVLDRLDPCPTDCMGNDLITQ